MKLPPFARILAAPLLILACSGAAQADSTSMPTTCKDGTTSTATGRGACSGHGGVQKAPSASQAPTAAPPSMATAPAAPGPAAPAKPEAPASTAAPAKPASTGDTNSTGATAKCKDGSYSKSKRHSGTCSSHGGVDQWLDASK